MKKVLGLDLGTNSIGWAIVQHNEDLSYSLLDKGVNIFQDGVAHDKSGEKPMVAERTAARSSRRHYFRRRLRKIELLHVLVKNNLCPYLSPEELSDWKNRKLYPLRDEFLDWQKTDDDSNKNPYHDRYICLTHKLDWQWYQTGTCLVVLSIIWFKDEDSLVIERKQPRIWMVRSKRI